MARPLLFTSTIKIIACANGCNRTKYKGQDVAVKEFHPGMLESEKAEFLKEVALLRFPYTRYFTWQPFPNSILHHPNLIRCVGASVVPPHQFIVTEYLPYS